jgi:hypothetical protein
MIEQHVLEDGRVQLRKLKSLADKALAQTRDADLFATLDPDANSIAAIMKHMAGNMRSRWTDFLTSDGEKPDRDRDDEFIVATMTRDALVAMWNDGWQRAFDALAALTPADLDKSVRIRGEAHSVIEAINRQMTNYASHVGQIVLLAKHYAGPGWTSLSIPRGQSKAFDVSKRGEPYAFKTR